MTAARLINRATAIPCTGCGYCMKDCPKNICIPNYFRLYNEYFRNQKDDWKIIPAYQHLASRYGRAADCMGCRSCERNCPQKLPVTECLSKVKGIFD